MDLCLDLKNTLPKRVYQGRHHLANSQTTHYDPILRDIDDIFGKDSVWFTEKGKDGNSNLAKQIYLQASQLHRTVYKDRKDVIICDSMPSIEIMQNCKVHFTIPNDLKIAR